MPPHRGGGSGTHDEPHVEILLPQKRARGWGGGGHLLQFLLHHLEGDSSHHHFKSFPVDYREAVFNNENPQCSLSLHVLPDVAVSEEADDLSYSHSHRLNVYSHSLQLRGGL